MPGALWLSTSKMHPRIGSIPFLILCTLAWCKADQDTIDYLASSIVVEYHVVNNFASNVTFDGLIVLENIGSQTITDLNWSLYFCSLKIVEPGDDVSEGGADLGDTDLWVYHINGNLYRIEPTANFTGFAAGERLDVSFAGGYSQVQATDTQPNWYFDGPGAEPRVITSTAGEDFSWVGPFNTPNQWKRSSFDYYDPYSGPTRLSMQNYSNLGHAPALIIPTPVEDMLDKESTVNIGTGDWMVVVGVPAVRPEAEFLAVQLGMVAVDPEFTPASRYITVTLGDISDGDNQPITTPESYRLDVKDGKILVTGIDRAGAFHGGQSLFSMFEGSVDIPSGYVVDYPRFNYRGYHIDVGRNFYDKEAILRHLDVMSLYKLNKFHFHLTEDEGWRLEIPGLPELTEIGSRRCHDLSGDYCLLPQYGSAPGLVNDGTGYYTVDDYREILQYADSRHIQVIPEFDMPGHCAASIQSMNARYRKYIDTNETAAREFLLVDLNDTSSYISVQKFRNNSMNACVGSTYTFISHVMGEVKQMHSDIQTLKTFMFGGDEVPEGAWEGSPACDVLGEEDIMKYFVTRVAQEAHEQGLDLAGWEDAFLDRGAAINISSFPNRNLYAYAWSNVFELGGGENAYVLANGGYKTILAPATHLYFDHPYEPDPYDRGQYWATRLSPSPKVFGFMPDDFYENIGDASNGRPLNQTNICALYGCEPLEPENEANIIGIQGQLWSETVRNVEYLDYMVFPRLVAMAERAWHKADWEYELDPEYREVLQNVDWERFANTLGYKELKRLDTRNVQYAITPPGARIASGNVLEALAEYPGQPVQWSADGGQTWTDYADGVIMAPGNLQIVTRTNDRRRSSRIVNLEVVM